MPGNTGVCRAWGIPDETLNETLNETLYETLY
jgi:hypothetical protein